MTTRYYLRIMESLGMGLIPLTVGLAIVAPEAVAIALGSQWADAVPVVRIFVLATLFQAVNALNSQVLLPLREVKFVMWINIVSLVVIPVVCLAVSPFGIAAIASVWLASSPTVALLTTARLRKGISLEWLQIARALAPSIVGGSVMAILLAWLMLQKWFPSENHIYLRLTLIVVAGGIVYTGTLLVFFRNVMSRYFHFLRAAAKGNSSQLMAND